MPTTTPGHRVVGSERDSNQGSELQRKHEQHARPLATKGTCVGRHYQHWHCHSRLRVLCIRPSPHAPHGLPAPSSTPWTSKSPHDRCSRQNQRMQRQNIGVSFVRLCSFRFNLGPLQKTDRHLQQDQTKRSDTLARNQACTHDTLVTGRSSDSLHRKHFLRNNKL